MSFTGTTSTAFRSQPQVGDEARGSPPAGQHGFENWRLTRRKGRRKGAHRSHHDLTNEQNLCVFRSDGVFGSHRGVSVTLLKILLGPGPPKQIRRHTNCYGADDGAGGLNLVRINVCKIGASESA